MHGDRKINYLDRVVGIEYRGLKCSIKSYRHRHYSRYSRENPEYHPKLELTIVKEHAKLSEITLETIHTGAILLNTIIETLKLKLLHSEYDTQQESIRVLGVDREVSRIIKGVKKRVKAIYILEREYHDIRLAIAELLVEKKMRIVNIAKLLDYSERWIKKIVEELVQSGVIKRIGKGKYTRTKLKVELPKTQITRHIHVKTIQELTELIKTIGEQHKLIDIFTHGNIVITYETEHEKIRLITNIVSYNNHAEIIDPITHKRQLARVKRSQLLQLLNS